MLPSPPSGHFYPTSSSISVSVSVSSSAYTHLVTPLEPLSRLVQHRTLPHHLASPHFARIVSTTCSTSFHTCIYIKSEKFAILFILYNVSLLSSCPSLLTRQLSRCTYPICTRIPHYHTHLSPSSHHHSFRLFNHTCQLYHCPSSSRHSKSFITSICIFVPLLVLSSFFDFDFLSCYLLFTCPLSLFAFALSIFFFFFFFRVFAVFFDTP